MLRSESPTYTSRACVEFSGESWLYVNGVCCDQTWLALNCEALAAIFGRRVVGIYNRTYWFVFDLLECIIQRDLGYITDDVKRLYAITMRELLDANNKKVVLIAHSQVRIKLYSKVGSIDGVWGGALELTNNFNLLYCTIGRHYRKLGC